MSTKHTPGPWEVAASEVYAPASGHVVAAMHPVAPFVSPERAANARLIAAAPEMFEALRILTAFAATHTGNGATSEEGRTLDAYGDDVAYAVTQARAALAKAVRP